MGLRILFGGIATVPTGLIGKICGPFFPGLFPAFPAIFPATASLVEKHTKERRLKAGLDGSLRAAEAVAIEARGAMMGSIGMLVFAAVVWLVLPRAAAPLALAIAGIAWLVSSVSV